MGEIQSSFKRYEKKFLITEEQYEKLIPVLRTKMNEDKYGEYTICNIYYDTDSYDLIRTSLDKPVYKEKIRIRSYGVPKPDDKIFAEIKKKYDGVVYKRRIAASYDEIKTFITQQKLIPNNDIQIQKEILFLMNLYNPKPKAFIGYDRSALAGKDDSELRVTFDRNIRWRNKDLDLCLGDYGEPVMKDGKIVMEIKISSAMPLWLSQALSENLIYPASFSKYGTCYKNFLVKDFKKETAKIVPMCSYIAQNQQREAL